MTDGVRVSWRAIYAAAWLPLSGVYAALYLSSGSSAGMALRGTLATVLPYVLLGLFVVGLPNRVPWPEEKRPRFFAIQIALALAYTLAGTTGRLALLALDQLVTTGSVVRHPTWLVIAWQAVIGTLVYDSIAGVAYALKNAARVRAEAGRAARADALRARAELALLRTQLNPHFLMNTLHTLMGLVRREPALAERALERLGDLLHYGLRLHRESVDQVTLREEWRFVCGYLEIESLRMGERLVVHLEGDERVMNCLIPPFALQPLVENAIVHALAPRKDGGRLSVTAHQRGERLRLEVCDDGPGLSATPVAGGAGLGLRLLRERLAMLYADRAELRVEPAAGRGVKATLDFPIERGRPAESP